MSVLIMHEKAYEYVLNGLITTAFRRTCDELYAYGISQHFKGKDINAEATRLVTNWAKINELSFNARYNDTGLIHYRQINKSAIWKVDCYQLLKYIDCINYNIEIDTIEKSPIVKVGSVTWAEFKEDYELLKKWQYELTRAIVTKRTEYDNAEWSKEPKPTSLISY